jgi:hypothetical protein
MKILPFSVFSNRPRFIACSIRSSQGMMESCRTPGLMLDVVVRRPAQIADLVRRNSLQTCDFAALELPRLKKLRNLRRDRVGLERHPFFEHCQPMRVLEARVLLFELLLQPLRGFLADIARDAAGNRQEWDPFPKNFAPNVSIAFERPSASRFCMIGRYGK